MHIENGSARYGIVLKVLNELNEFFTNWYDGNGIGLCLYNRNETV